MNRITVRKAGPQHLRTVAEMACSLEKELWREDAKELRHEELVLFLENTLADETMHFCAFVALLDEVVVGILTVCEKRALYALGTVGEIMEMYVLPEHRSRGIGRHLMNAVLEHGRQRGWALTEVGAPHQPEWAGTAEFYRRSGFREIGPRLEREL